MKDGQQEEEKKEAIVLQAMTMSQMETRREAATKVGNRNESEIQVHDSRRGNQERKYRSIECQAHIHKGKHMMAAAVTLRLVRSHRSGGQSARVSREAVVRHHMQEMKYNKTKELYRDRGS